MEIKKCSMKKHSEIDAINYCKECKIYICNKCKNHHSELFEEHHLLNLEKDLKYIFTDCCEIHKQHQLELFCKTHNKLCCLACVYNLSKKGYGQHKNCEICEIENIKDEKKNNLKKNIKMLESLLKGLENSIKEITALFEKINENKEELKLKIQKIFTKIRNALNEREDELLIEVNNQFNELYINEELIQDSGKLPNKVKISLEKGRETDQNWDNNTNLNSLINDCINIENNIKEINLIKEKIECCNPNNNITIHFIPNDDKDINPFLETIKKFGIVKDNSIRNSNIFKSLNEFEFILTYLKKEENSKKISLNLLYQATKDGENSSDFHNKCDGKTPQLIFIKTKKGEIFGGYTKEGFKGRDKYVVDNKAFVFSISNKKIYNIINGKDAIYDYKDCGPCFLSDNYFIINIQGKIIGSQGNTCSKSQSYYQGVTKDNELNNGEFYFYIQEMEVYQIFFN